MLHTEIDSMIASAMKAREKELLEVLKLIKCEFVKAEKDGVILDEVSEAKILLKMASQREDSIKQYIDGGRPDLADKEKGELSIISKYLPKQASDEEIAEYTSGAISAYVLSKPEGHKLSMKDMKPIMTLVQATYPNANGRVISQTLNKVINGK
jgi:hypothetical protein